MARETELADMLTAMLNTVPNEAVIRESAAALHRLGDDPYEWTESEYNSPPSVDAIIAALAKKLRNHVGDDGNRNTFVSIWILRRSADYLKKQQARIEELEAERDEWAKVDMTD